MISNQKNYIPEKTRKYDHLFLLSLKAPALCVYIYILVGYYKVQPKFVNSNHVVSVASFWRYIRSYTHFKGNSNIEREKP